MPIFYVYILRCIGKAETNSFYTGSTQDLLVRFDQHRLGKGAKYTHGKELELVYFETFSNRGDAMRREYEIKNLSPKKKKELVEKFQAKMI